MHRMSFEQWNAVIQTNLASCFNMSRAVIEGMRTRGFGRIVNIGSVNGQAGQYGQVNYAAAKSGIHGFTKALALEGAARGITVNAVAPGYVDTEMVRAVPPEVLEKIIARIPAGRLGKAEDIARTVFVPGRRRRRFHHRLDPLDQWRPAHVLTGTWIDDADRPSGPAGASGSVFGGGLGRAAMARYRDLEYQDGRLLWPGGSALAAVGRTGVAAVKKEGDGATPAGTYPLVSGFYRADRMAPPRSGLSMRALSPGDAWVDDPADRNYNRLITLPYPAHSEPMWLDDAVYDLLVVIGYNIGPGRPRRRQRHLPARRPARFLADSGLHRGRTGSSDPPDAIPRTRQHDRDPRLVSDAPGDCVGGPRFPRGHAVEHAVAMDQRMR